MTRFTKEQSHQRLIRTQAFSLRDAFRRVPSHARSAHGVCPALPRPRGRSRPPHPFHSKASCSFASTSSSTFFRASPPRPPRDLRRGSGERARLKARRTDVCSPHSFVFKDEQLLLRLVQLPVSIHELSPASLSDGAPRFTASTPRFGGPVDVLSSVFFSTNTQSTVPLTPRHFPGHPGLFRPFLRLSRARFHRASVFDARLSRARTPSTNRFSPRESEPTPESRVVDSNDELRALFTRGLSPRARRPRSSTAFTAEPPPPGLACQLLQLVTTRGHIRGSNRPSPSSDDRGERGSEETVRAERQHPRVRAIVP